jgi:hypothetical protein
MMGVDACVAVTGLVALRSVAVPVVAWFMAATAISLFVVMRPVLLMTVVAMVAVHDPSTSPAGGPQPPVAP